VELTRIRHKVESGERLSNDELDALSRAARQEGGPQLRTAVAQALMNAEASHEALPLLEAVRRDFPSDVHVHLALGRALVSLERWAEAEAPLRRALELNPKDPEPTKALAVVAMRRGEFERARTWVEEVLQVDPFDAEAQQLSEELAHLTPAPSRQRPSQAVFTRALVAQLAAQSTPHLIQKNQVLVRLGKGGVARLELDQLYQDFVQSGRSLEEAVVAMAAELAERVLGLPPGRLHLLAKVLPVLRDSSFLERGLGAARREGPQGLWVFYVIDDPELVRYVPQGLLDAHGLSMEQLDDAAWKNLEARPADVRALELEQGALRLSATPTGLWALAHGDGHDAARLLTPSHQAALTRALGAGPWRVYLGLRELVLLCRLADAPAVKKLEGLDAAREGIGGAWQLDSGRLQALPEWDL
jgi:tetratricopeptide (TPR) repeat protein